MSISGIIDQTFKLYRSNFRDIFLFTLLIGGTADMIAALLQLGTGASSMSTIFGNMLSGQSFLEGVATFSGTGSSSVLAGALSIVFKLFVTPLVNGGITAITLDSAHGSNDGRHLSNNLSRYGKFLKTWLALMVVAMLFSIIALIMLGIFEVLHISYVVSSLGLAVAVLALGIIYVFAYPVAIQENRYGFAWLSRAWKLFSHKKAKTVGLVLLVGILVQLLSMVLVAAFVLFVPMLFSTIVSVLIASLMTPITLIAFTLLYLDIRITTEGYDLEIRVASMNDKLGFSTPAEQVAEAPEVLNE